MGKAVGLAVEFGVVQVQLAKLDGYGVGTQPDLVFEALRDVLVASRWACLGPDRIDTRFALAREMFDVAEASSDASLAAVGHEVLMGAHILRGDLQAGDRELAAYARGMTARRRP